VGREGVEVRRHAGGAAGDETQVFSAKAFHHHHHDVGTSRRRHAGLGRDVGERIVVARPVRAGWQADERPQVGDRLVLGAIERNPVEAEILARECRFDRRRRNRPGHRARKRCGEDAAGDERRRWAERRRFVVAAIGGEHLPHHPPHQRGERQHAEQRHAPVRAQRLEELIRPHDLQSAERAKHGRRQRRSGD
jgi:hypothetical protein